MFHWQAGIVAASCSFFLRSTRSGGRHCAEIALPALQMESSPGAQRIARDVTGGRRYWRRQWPWVGVHALAVVRGPRAAPCALLPPARCSRCAPLSFRAACEVVRALAVHSLVAVRCMPGWTGHVNLKARKCRARGCTRQATYGAAPDGEGMPTGKALFCLQHKGETDIDIRSRTCCAPGCSRQPSFHDPLTPGTLLCSKHARAREGGRLPPFTHRTTLVRLGQRTCGVTGCSTVANFGQELPDGSCFRRRCLVHKSPEDLDLTRRICSVTGCSRRSAARPLSAGKAGLGGHEQLCLQHAHVNLPVRRMAGRREGKKRGGFMAGDEPCVFPVTGGCRARAEYGDDENGVALFCEEHRAAYHVHVGRSSRWGSAEGDGFVSSKRKRAGLVRRLYALAADVPIAEDTGAWLWGAGEEARLRELERDRAVEAEMEFFVGAQEERLEQNRVSGAQEHES